MTTPEYRSWTHMWNRARNHPKYANIRVCLSWTSFENFFSDMGPRPAGTTLDRRNNSGHYEPRNCRWATKREQQQNRANNRILKIGGTTHCIAEWCRILNIRPGLVWQRLTYGWRPLRALTTPSRGRRRNGG